MKTYPATVEGFHDVLWDFVPYLKMSDVKEYPPYFRVNVGLKFRWWVYWVPFLQGRLLKKAEEAIELMRPMYLEVNVFSQPYGLRGWSTRKG